MAQFQCSSALSYGPDPRQLADVMVPESSGAAPLLVLLHAGWWRRGHRHDLLSTAFELADRGYSVATLGYRLLQGSRSGGDLIADMVQGLRVAIEEAQVLGADCGRRIILVGSGAGGLLALYALQALRSAAQEQSVQVCGVAMVGTAPGFQPWNDCPQEIAEALQQFASGDHLPDPLGAEAAHLPPLLLMHGDHDPEVPVRLAQELHSKVIQGEGASTLAIIAGASHRFLEDPTSQAGRSALNRLQEWIKKLGEGAIATGDDVRVGDPAWL